jgi:hypothetical protein
MGTVRHARPSRHGSLLWAQAQSWPRVTAAPHPWPSQTSIGSAIRLANLVAPPACSLVTSGTGGIR